MLCSSGNLRPITEQHAERPPRPGGPQRRADPDGGTGRLHRRRRSPDLGRRGSSRRRDQRPLPALREQGGPAPPARAGDGLRRYVEEAETAVGDEGDPWEAFAAFVRRIVDADVHALTSASPGLVHPDRGHVRRRAASGRAERPASRSNEGDRRPAPRHRVDDLSLILEQLSAIRLGDDGRPGASAALPGAVSRRPPDEGDRAARPAADADGARLSAGYHGLAETPSTRTSPMTSIMSRSQGRKSWSMIRSTPAACEPARPCARASSGVPVIQRSRRSSSQASLVVRPSPNAVEQRAVRRSRPRPRSRPISTPAIVERASVAGSRPIARQAASSAAYAVARLVRRRRAEVELVRVARGQPDTSAATPRRRRGSAAARRRSASAAGPATSTGFGWNCASRDRDLVARRTTSRHARPRVRARSRATPRVGPSAPRPGPGTEMANSACSCLVPAAAWRPISTRPPLISSTVAAVFANTPGWRNVTGETIDPQADRVSVSRARPARVVHASVVRLGRPPRGS